MAAVDDLIGALAEDGEIEALGAFSLDADKAREKMRQFQLSDPRRYVLLLVAAAAEKGATRVDFEIDTDDMRARWDGTPLDREDLEELYISMFGDRSNPRLRARQELAVALNAAMALTPRFIRLTSAGEDGQGVSLRMRPGKDDEIEEAKGLPPGTVLHVKDRFRAGLFLRFVQNLRGRIPEELVLEEACAHSDRLVMLDGERISHGMTLDEVWGEARVDGHAAKIVAGFAPIGEPAALTILLHGVIVATHELPDLPRGLVAMADARGLRRDVSQADVVRDRAYAAMLGDLDRAIDASLLELIGDVRWQIHGVPFEASEDDEDDEADQDDDLPASASAATSVKATAMLARMTANQVLAPWVPAMLRGELGRRARRRSTGGGPDEVLDTLRTLPLWTNLDGVHVTTQQLDAADKRVPFSAERPPFWSPGRGGYVFAPDVATRSALRRVFDTRVVDRTRTLEREAVREENRQRWRARPRTASLGEGVYLGRVPIEGEGVTGEVGVRDGGTERPTISLIVDGCLLLEVEPKVSLPGLVVVLEADLLPNARFDGVHRNTNLARALLSVLRAVERVMTAVATRLHRTHPDPRHRAFVRRYVESVSSRPELAEKLYVAFGYKRRRIDNLLRRVDDARPHSFVPKWGLGEGETPHATMQLPLIPAMVVGFVSIADIAEIVRTEGAVAWVGMELPQLEPPRLVLRLGAEALGLLERLIGADGLYDASGDYSRWRARAEFMGRPTREMKLAAPGLGGPVPFSTATGRGLVGLAWPDPTGPAGAATRLRIEARIAARHLGLVALACDLPGVVAIYDDESIAHDAGYDGIADDDEKERIASLVLQALADAMIARLDPAQGASATERAAPLGVAARQWLLAAAVGTPSAMRPETPSSSALRQRLSSVRDRLMAMPLWECVDGRTVSGQEILDSQQSDPQLLWVPRRDAALAAGVDTDGRIVLRLCADERRSLACLVSELDLDDGRPWLEALQQRRAFEAKPIIEQLVVGNDALVRVAIDHEGARGEAALGRTPRDGGNATVRACRERRQIRWVELAVSVAVVAIVDADDLGGGPGGDLDDADLQRLTTLLEAQVEPLVHRLADTWHSFGEADRRSAETWVRVLLAQRGRHGVWHDDQQAVSRLAPLPAFPLLTGGRASLVELMKAHARHDRVRVALGLAGSTAPAPDDEPVVDARNLEVGAQLEQLVPTVREHEDLLAIEREVARNRSRAADAPTAPAQPVAAQPVEASTVQGSLWLPSATTGVAIVHAVDRGKVAFRWCTDGTAEPGLERVLPCVGTVEGSGVAPDERWRGVELGGKARASIEGASVELYFALVRRWQGYLAAETDAVSRTADGPAPAAMRTWLMRGASMLARQQAEGGIHDPRRRRLLRELESQPLLTLASGRRISIRTARKERPAELAHLGLWTPAPLEPEALAAVVADLERDNDSSSAPPADSLTPSAATPPLGEPEPEPAPPPTPQARLLEAVRSELRMVRAGNRELLSDAHLDGLAIEHRGGDAVAHPASPAVLDADHRVVQAVLERFETDATAVSFLASAVYTALNVRLGEITDTDEASFVRLHAEHVATAAAE